MGGGVRGEIGHGGTEGAEAEAQRQERRGCREELESRQSTVDSRRGKQKKASGFQRKLLNGCKRVERREERCVFG